MKDERACEDRVILSLLGAGRPEESGASLAQGEDAETLHRLYTEVLGLLAQEPAPVAPRPETRERLLASLRAGGAATADLAPPAPQPPAAEVVPFPIPDQTAPAPEPAAPPRRVWPWLAAAGLALAAISALWVQSSLDLRAARSQAAGLGRDLAASRERERAASERLAGLELDLAGLSSKLGMVTQAGSLVCPLRPQPGGPGSQARGAVYIAADHQHWFLRVVGLPPVPAGETYQLWFLTAEGPVSGGVFRTAAGADAEIGSPTMPGGIVGFAVTVEPAPGAASPTGPRVLAGSETRELL